MCASKMASDVENDSPDERIEECKIMDSDVLVLKKKTKAFVLNYFGFETDSNGHPCCVNSRNVACVKLQCIAEIIGIFCYSNSCFQNK